MAGIVEAITSLKAAKDILQALHSHRVAREVERQIRDISNHLMAAHEATMSAQADQAAMRCRIRELEEQMVQLEDWSTEKQRYELREAAPGRKVFVYTIKESVQDGDPAHSLCPNCYNDRVKSILQLAYYGASRHGPKSGSRLECTLCRFGVQIK